MSVLRALIMKGATLFVGDGPSAAAVLCWIVACAIVLPHIPSPFGGVLLFGGNAAILATAVAVRARSGRR